MSGLEARLAGGTDEYRVAGLHRPHEHEHNCGGHHRRGREITMVARHYHPPRAPLPCRG